MFNFNKDKTKYELLPLNKGSNSETSHIFVNGFMSDEKEEYKAIDWQNGLERFIKSSDKKFIYKWESSFDYSKLKNHIPFKNGFKHEMKKIKHLLPLGASLSTVTRLNPFMILPTSFSSFCLEEWKISKENSIKYGLSLAEEINTLKISNDKIYLYAHSLGVNLVKNTLIELGKQNIFVEKVFLFGGASCNKNKKEWKNSKVSKKHAEETGNPDMTNAEYYNLDDKRIKEAYDKSKNFITKTQLKKQVIKQGKELVSTGALESAKMGIQQAIGLIMSEFFTALFDEILDIYKNGFSNGFEDDRFFSVLKERIIRIAKKIQAKWKDVVVAFKDGLLSGFISNFVTTMVNIFATTWKRFVRIIREGIFSLFKAIKILIFPPEDLTFTDVMHEAKKIIATGLMVSLGVLLEEAVSNFFKGIPFSNILTSVFVGALTGIAITMTVYYIDKKKNDKDAINQMIKETDEKFENVEMLLNKLSLY